MFASLKQKIWFPNGWKLLWKFRNVKNGKYDGYLQTFRDNLFAWRYIVGFVSKNVSKWTFRLFVYFLSIDVFSDQNIGIKAHVRLMCARNNGKHLRKQWQNKQFFLSLNEDNMASNMETCQEKRLNFSDLEKERKLCAVRKWWIMVFF